jgi:hypothetical protein
MAWSGRSREAYDSQWAGKHRYAGSGWDWHDIFSRYREVDVFDLVIWGPDDRLSGLALATTTGPAVLLHFVEGDPKQLYFMQKPLENQRFG